MLADATPAERFNDVGRHRRQIVQQNPWTYAKFHLEGIAVEFLGAGESCYLDLMNARPDDADFRPVVSLRSTTSEWLRSLLDEICRLG